MKLLLLSKVTKLWGNLKSVLKVLKYSRYGTFDVYNNKHTIIKIWTVLDKCTMCFLRNIYHYFTFHTLTNLYNIPSIYVYILNG